MYLFIRRKSPKWFQLKVSGFVVMWEVLQGRRHSSEEMGFEARGNHSVGSCHFT